MKISEQLINLSLEYLEAKILDALYAYNQIRIAELSNEIELAKTVTLALLKKLIREGKLGGSIDMINDVLVIHRRPAQPAKTGIYKKQSMQNNRTPKSPPSDAWYLVPLFLGIIGGLLGYLVVKDDDEGMAGNLLLLGIAVSVISVIAVIAYWSWIMSLFGF